MMLMIISGVVGTMMSLSLPRLLVEDCFLPNLHVHKQGQWNSLLSMITVTARDKVITNISVVLWNFAKIFAFQWRLLESFQAVSHFSRLRSWCWDHVKGNNVLKLQANKTISNSETDTYVAFWTLQISSMTWNVKFTCHSCSFVATNKT